MAIDGGFETGMFLGTINTLSRGRGGLVLLGLSLMWLTAGVASGQQNLPAKPAAQVQAAEDKQGVSAGKTSAVPRPSVNSDQAIYLVRSALLTLNDADRSGNYTVLRDLAAPDFQARNTPADLAQSFADLRRRNFDLFAAAILAPQFTAEPALDADGRMRLTGLFLTRPLQISFDLTFQSVNGQWRLLAISVATPEARATHSQVSSPPPRRSSRPLYGLQIFAGTAGWRW
jgi:hypothetical protein